MCLIAQNNTFHYKSQKLVFLNRQELRLVLLMPKWIILMESGKLVFKHHFYKLSQALYLPLIFSNKTIASQSSSVWMQSGIQGKEEVTSLIAAMITNGNMWLPAASPFFHPAPHPKLKPGTVAPITWLLLPHHVLPYPVTPWSQSVTTQKRNVMIIWLYAYFNDQ